MRHIESVTGTSAPNYLPTGSKDRRALGEASQLLRTIDLYDGRVTGPGLDELAEVLKEDYREAQGLPSSELARRLAEIAKSGIDPRRGRWKKWRISEDFRVRLREFDSREIAVHAQPYTRGAGLALWGFSCDARIGDKGAFVIFLNTAHQPGAVAATAAHELGHYIYRSIAPENCNTMAPLAANFASHLEDRSELFSDSLAALSAYSLEALETVNPSRGTSMGSEEIVGALRVIDPDYRIDFAHKSVSPLWRIRYLAATIHFYKLRKALRETAGI